MGDDVFARRWVLGEDELLRMLWRSHSGENPDVVLLKLYASGRREDRRRRSQSCTGRTPRATRHVRRHAEPGQ